MDMAGCTEGCFVECDLIRKLLRLAVQSDVLNKLATDVPDLHSASCLLSQLQVVDWKSESSLASAAAKAGISVSQGTQGLERRSEIRREVSLGDICSFLGGNEGMTPVTRPVASIRFIPKTLGY